MCLNSVNLPGVRVYMSVSKIGNLLKFFKRHFNFAKLSFIGGHLILEGKKLAGTDFFWGGRGISKF